MIDKITIDPEVEVTPDVLAKKLNEVIELLSKPLVRPGMPTRSAPGKLECAERMGVLTQRLHDDLFVRISRDDSSDEVKAIDTAITTLQEALTVFITGLK